MTKKRIGCIGLIALPVCLLAAAYFSVCVLPRLQSERFKALWTKNFEDYTLGQEHSAEWKNDVYMRHLPNGEWALAAMYHGSCSSGGKRGQFNAAVLLDNHGRISTWDWSPCAGGGITELGASWKGMVPAASLEELYNNQKIYEKDEATKKSGEQ